MKRFIFVMLLVAILLISGCTGYLDSYEVKQSTPGSGTIYFDYYFKLDDSISDIDDIDLNSATFKVTDNGAKIYFIKPGDYSSETNLDSKHVKAFDATKSVNVIPLGNDMYRMSIDYSGLANGNYEVHWKALSSASSDILSITAWNSANQQITTNFLHYITPNEYTGESDAKKCITIKVTNNVASPKTGDSAHLILWALAALVGCGGIIVLSRKKVRG